MGTRAGPIRGRPFAADLLVKISGLLFNVLCSHTVPGGEQGLRLDCSAIGSTADGYLLED